MALAGWNANNKLILTIDSTKVDEDLTDFPVLITLSSGTGQTNFDASGVFDELLSVSGTKRIAVTTMVSGVETELYVEIENWDWENEQAWLWTKIPTIVSGTDTTLYLYYDSTHTTNSGYIGDTGETPAQNVWDSNFKGVWHLEQDLSGGSNTIKDSTSNSNDGTPSGFISSDLIDGTISKAAQLDSDNDINCGNATSLDLSQVTIEAIAYNPSALTGADRRGWVQKGQVGSSAIDYALQYYQSAGVYMYIASSSNWFGTSFANQAGNWIYLAVDYDGTGSIGNAYLNGAPLSGLSSGGSFGAIPDTGYDFHIGRWGANYMDGGAFDEVRISSIVRLAAWMKTTYYSNFDDLITYAQGIEPTIFTFSGPIPIHLSTVYGTSHTLQLTTTITGADPSYVYEAIFYNDSNNQIGSTVSNVDSGEAASTTLSTPAGIDYSWYVTATSSGESDTSQTYTFTNRFLASGYTEINGTRASGVAVRLYRRSTGVLVSGTESTGVSGTFSIETPYNEAHYAVALHPTDSGTNALIYDYLTP